MKIRYAGIDVGYLLQQVENFESILIVTTNLLKRSSKAFSRARTSDKSLGSDLFKI